MSTRSVYQRFSFVSLLIILSLLLPASSLPAVAQPPQAAPERAFRSSSVMFIENVGQFADGALDADITAVLASATQVAAGAYHTCALTTSGGVKCWGDNGYGQLGDGTTTDRYTPTDVSGLASGVTAIAAGAYHTCALPTGGGIKCWGRNDYGQLGDGTTTARYTPVDVSGLASGVMAIAAGWGHTCALTVGGGVQCWGYNHYGQLGDGTTTTRYTPVDVSSLASGVTAIVAGGYHTCALMDAIHGDGVKCWGRNDDGQLGDGTTTWRYTPVDVSGLASGVTAIAARGWHTCALLDAVRGGVQCWGSNYHGQLGDGTTTTRYTPVDVSGLASGVTAIASGWYHTCALMDAIHGGIKCWGWNSFGQLGDGTISDRTTPVAVSGLADGVTTITAGLYHTCALMDAGRGGVKCWGANSDGQLGDGTTTDRHTPVDVVGFEGQVTYSVSGRVTDGNGNAIAGVSVSVGSAGSTTTDSNGAYSISGLAAGTYTIAPSKPGYTFTPATRTVTVPPNATGQDFTGMLPPTATATPTPTVTATPTATTTATLTATPTPSATPTTKPLRHVNLPLVLR